MTEYDLVNPPGVLDQNDDSTNDIRRYEYKVQCLVGGRCFLRGEVDYPLDEKAILGWSWWTDDRQMLDWFYFREGSKNLMLDTMFDINNIDPYISGGYCDRNATCSIICTDSCLCAVGDMSTTTTPEECVVKKEYPDLVLPPFDEHIVYEFRQEYDEWVIPDSILQLRCSDFLNGCYLDLNKVSTYASGSVSDYDGFYAENFEACLGDMWGTVPCYIGCDPGCTCTILNRIDNTTQDCLVATHTMVPTTAFTIETTTAPSSPTSDVPNATAFTIETTTAPFSPTSDVPNTTAFTIETITAPSSPTSDVPDTTAFTIETTTAPSSPTSDVPHTWSWKVVFWIVMIAVAFLATVSLLLPRHRLIPLSTPVMGSGL
jgi:hypothetical protein